VEPWEHSSHHHKDGSVKERLDQLAEDIKKLPPDRIAKIEKLVKSMDKRAVSLKQAAEMLGVSVQTLRRARDTGALKAFRIKPTGNWLVSIDEVEKFLRGNDG
jgi:excisionase family DNA binding protein